MAAKFSKKKIQNNKPKEDLTKDDRFQAVWELATNKAYYDNIIHMMIIPLVIAKRELLWNEEQLNWFADQIEKEFNNNVAKGKISPSKYANWAAKNVGIRFESVWLDPEDKYDE